MRSSSRLMRGMVAGLALATLSLAGVGAAQAQAEPGAAGAGAKAGPPGAGTRQWLEAQRTGTQASPRVQRLPEAARTRALERYLDSFSHPIPETYFDRDRFEVR